METKTIKNVMLGQSLAGEFTIKNPDKRVTKNKKSYLIFDIKTSLLPVKAIAWENSCIGLDSIWHGQTINVEGKWELFNGQWQIRCNSLRYTNKQAKEISQAKTRLRVLLAWIPQTTLKTFLVKILNDKLIVEDFSKAPASLRHHHAFPGGLLVHSVDVAWQIFSQQKLPEKERYLGAVVGLLHDFGKLKTLSFDMKRTQLGSNINHEQLTLEIISSHLSWLDSVDSELSTAVRYLLSWKPKSYDRIPKLDVYEVIQAADRVSAGSAVSWSQNKLVQ